jgi:uncharacterized delta-60 repeat protein
MSFVLLGILNAQAAGGGVSYWLSSLGNNEQNSMESVATDSSDNVYGIGFTSATGAGGQDYLLVKYDPAGAIQWQRTLGIATSDFGFGGTADSSGNVYVTGQRRFASYNDILTAKYNSSGTLQWERAASVNSYEGGVDVKVDSSGNVYALAQTDAAGQGGSIYLLIKYNSAGTLQFQKAYGSTLNEYPSSLTIDSSDNIYMTGAVYSAPTHYDFLTIKVNTSGAIQWARTFGGSDADYAESIITDSSGNVYVHGRTSSYGPGTGAFLIAKYNSSGTLQWQKTLGGTSTDTGNAVAIDSSGNVYIGGNGQNDNAGTRDYYFAKFDSSGTLQWQRMLGGTDQDRVASMTVDSQDTLYVAGTSENYGGTEKCALFGKLPSDGSLTGTYTLNGVDIIYQAGSGTVGTPTATSASSSVTAVTTSLSTPTASGTSASASLTQYLTEI